MSGTPDSQIDDPDILPLQESSEQIYDIQSSLVEILNTPSESIGKTRSNLQASYSLPSGDELAKYPPEIQRIIAIEWVENRKHRTATESRRQKFGCILHLVGMLLGFILALTMIVGSVHIIVSGYSNEGLLGIGGTVVTIAGVFVYTDRRKS